MEEINFRRARKEDLDELVNYWEEFMEHHLALENDSDKQDWIELSKDASKKRRSHFEDQIEDEDGFVLVAKYNDEITGFVTASLEDRPPIFKEKKLGKVEELFVKRRYRSKGLGEELVDRAVDWLQGKDIELLKIRVLEANERANNFWDSLGFEDHITIKFKEPNEN